MQQVDVFNLALGYCLHSRAVQSADDGSLEAETCKRFWSLAVSRALSATDWPFASKEEALADIGSPPAPWGYRYRLPSDCVAPREIWSGTRAPDAASRVKFDLGEDARTLYTDVTPATLRYTRLIDNPVLWPSYFVEAAAWKLAEYIAGPLTKDPKLADRARQGFLLAQSAGRADAFNQQREDRRTSRAISARSC